MAFGRGRLSSASATRCEPIVSISTHLPFLPSGRLRHTPARRLLMMSQGLTPAAESLACTSGGGRRVGTAARKMPAYSAVSSSATCESLSPEVVETETEIESRAGETLRSKSFTAT